MGITEATELLLPGGWVSVREIEAVKDGVLFVSMVGKLTFVKHSAVQGWRRNIKPVENHSRFDLEV